MSSEKRECRELVTRSAEETRDLGRGLAEILQPGDVVLLVGELGAGKTCFAQGVARGLEIGEHVTSPTFNLMREYRGRLALYHLDAYRLDGPADLFAIGVDEYLEGDGVLLVEWGDRVRDFFDPEYLEVGFFFDRSDDDRRVVFRPLGEPWEHRLLEMHVGDGADGGG